MVATPVNKFAINKLVKLMMLWTTGPRILTRVKNQISFCMVQRLWVEHTKTGQTEQMHRLIQVVDFAYVLIFKASFKFSIFQGK